MEPRQSAGTVRTVQDVRHKNSLQRSNKTRKKRTVHKEGDTEEKKISYKEEEGEMAT